MEVGETVTVGANDAILVGLPLTVLDEEADVEPVLGMGMERKKVSRAVPAFRCAWRWRRRRRRG